jgi:hypothetical protein
LHYHWEARMDRARICEVLEAKAVHRILEVHCIAMAHAA